MSQSNYQLYNDSASSSSRPTPQPQPLDMFPDSAMFPDPDEDGSEENIFRDMSFQDILEELNARFLVNLPREEQGLVRVYWQAEQAHWFYEDYLRPLNPLLPSLSQRNFTHLIIASSPLYTHLSDDEYDEVWEEYCKYKRMVPCCGGILINEDGDKVLMVRGWKANAGWSFPRGKINSAEAEEACAIREVEEETGFDLSGMINKKDSIQTQVSAQTITMFIVKGIDEGTVFETQTRKEIGAIEWVPLVELPTWTGKRGPKTTSEKGKKRFYNVTPFVGPLKRWLSEHGINPHPKKKPQAQRASDPVPFRALEPFQFGSPPSTPPRAAPTAHATHPPTPQQAQAQASALDHLFNRFIHKQNQDLHQGPGLEENKAGLERLFGNLSVLSPEQGVEDDKAREAKEDDALARLLAGLTGTPTPHPAEPEPVNPPTDRASKLLAMLNPSPSVHEAPQPSQAPAQSAAQASPSKTPRFPAGMRPHQASLLAVLSPEGNRSTPASVTSDDTVLPHMTRPTSLPTSPRPPSPDHAQVERSRKQRALLEQILGGMGLDAASQTTQSLSRYTAHDATRRSGSGPPASVPVTGGQYSPRRDHYSSAHQQTQPVGHVLGGAGTGRPPPPPYESPIYGIDRAQGHQAQQTQQIQHGGQQHAPASLQQYQSPPQQQPMQQAQGQYQNQPQQPAQTTQQAQQFPAQAQQHQQMSSYQPSRPFGPPASTQYPSGTAHTGPAGPSDLSQQYNHYRPMSQPLPQHPGAGLGGFNGHSISPPGPPGPTGPGGIGGHFAAPQPMSIGQPQGVYMGQNAPVYGYTRPPQGYPSQPGQAVPGPGIHFAPGPGPRPQSGHYGRGASLPPRPPPPGPGPYVSGPYTRYPDSMGSVGVGFNQVQGQAPPQGQGQQPGHFIHHPQPMPPVPPPGAAGQGIPLPGPGPNSGSPPRGNANGMYQPMPRSGNAGALLGILNDGRR